MTTSHPKIVLFHQDKTRLWMKLFVSNYTLVPCIVFNKIRWDQCELILCTVEDNPTPYQLQPWGEGSHFCIFEFAFEYTKYKYNFCEYWLTWQPPYFNWIAALGWKVLQNQIPLFDQFYDRKHINICHCLSILNNFNKQISYFSHCNVNTTKSTKRRTQLICQI